MRDFVTLDCATTNSGFAVFEEGKLISFGKLLFEGKSEHEKIISAAQVMNAFFKTYQTDTVVIESSFFSGNARVATDLALSQGAALAGASLAGVSKIGSLVPIQWQRGIGNPLLTREEKSAIMEAYPGKSASWYKAANQKYRKQKTLGIVNDHFNITVRDNDAGDAVGMGLYVITHPSGVRW